MRSPSNFPATMWSIHERILHRTLYVLAAFLDRKQYTLTASQYILSRLPNAKRKRADPAADAPSGAAPPAASVGAPSTSGRNLTVTMKPTKPSYPTVTLPSQTSSTSVYDLKSAYASQAGALDTTKIKLLRAKKPVADSKSIGDLLAEGGDEGTAEKNPTKEVVVEFSVMVMAGAGPAAAASPAVEKDKMDVDAAPVAQGPSGEELLKGDEFWSDLKGFLMQRIRDEGESDKLVKVFRGAWESSSTRP